MGKYLISLRKKDSNYCRRAVDRYFIYWGNWYRVHKLRQHITVFIQLTESEKEEGIRIGNAHYEANCTHDPVTGEAMYTGMGDFFDSLRENK